MASIKKRRGNTALSIITLMRTDRKDRNGKRILQKKKRNSVRRKSNISRGAGHLSLPIK